MTDQVKKRVYLKDVTFDFEANDESPLGPHIAYTTASVGGAASGLNAPLLLKSDEVKPLTKEDIDILKAAKEIRIEMSMEDFLQKFMGLYYSDAAVLSKLLGFESSMDKNEDNYEDWLESKLEAFTIIKSLEAESFYSLPGKEQRAVLADQESFEKALKEKQSVLIDYALSRVEKTENGQSTKREQPKTTNVNKQTGEEMTTATNVEDINKALKAELENLQKQLKEIQDKEDKRVEGQYIDKARSYQFIDETNVEAFGKLLKSLKDEDALLILDTLEKAKEAVDKAQDPMFERVSTRGEARDAEPVTKSKAATRAALEKLLESNKGDK